MQYFNLLLERIPSSFRIQAIQQLKAEGVKQPTVSQITARACKLYPQAQQTLNDETLEPCQG